MKFQLCLLIGLVVSLGSYQHANAEDTTDTGRVSAVVELSDGELQSLLQTGTFKMSIPVSYKNKVDSLILKRPDRFKDDVAVLFNEVEKRSGTIAISVDDSTIQQIAYQPVELKVYESGYTNILVRYRPGNGKQAKKPSKNDSVALKMLLKNGKTLTGRLADMTEFPLTSNLGKVKVKLNEVSHIGFQEDGELTVSMFNGDSLSGKSNFSSVLVNARWGQEKLEVEDISSMAATELPKQTVDQTAAQTAAAPVSTAPSLLNTPVVQAPQLYYGQQSQQYYGQQYPQYYGQQYPQYYGQQYPQYPQNQQQYYQYQFPVETGRIDTVPQSPRQLQRPVHQTLPTGTLYQGSVPFQNQTVLPAQGYNTIQNNGVIYGETPVNQVPISDFPIGNLPMGEPLPLMNPNQASEFWLFPQN